MSSTSMHVPYVMGRIESVEGKIVLDIGCGKGKWGFLIKIDRRGDLAYLVGLDVFRPYLEEVKQSGIYDDCVLCSAESLPCKDRCSDLVVACELLEHLSKDEGLKFLDELDRVCKSQILITTPSIFIFQSCEEIPSQTHRSVWSASELRQRGYDVSGMGYNGPLPPNVWEVERFAFSLERFVFQNRKSLVSRFLTLGYMLLNSLAFFLPVVAVFLIAEKKR